MKAVFIGLGRMGSGMARRILDAGLPLEVANRTSSRAAPFRERGAKVHGSVEEALAGADVAFSMLSDDRALESVVNDTTLASMAPGAVHVSMSTAGVSCVLAAAESARALGRRHLSAPVFGRPEAAAAGRLRLCVSGDRSAKAAVSAYLAPLGEIWDFGEDPCAAPAVKLAGNFMIASLIETLSEAFALVGSHGVRPNTVDLALSLTKPAWNAVPSLSIVTR
jgi:3-hydroxyisobutyrate dehydrogenase-like beta-hydroxyacid dehydrogenase